MYSYMCSALDSQTALLGVGCGFTQLNNNYVLPAVQIATVYMYMYTLS